MDNYIIHCNEKQLRLLESAVELQMRVRFGQGFGIIDNLSDFSAPKRYEFGEFYEPILDAILAKIIMNDKNRIRNEISNTRMIERDMWKSLVNTRYDENDDISLGEYGFMKIEVEEEKDGTNKRS